MLAQTPFCPACGAPQIRVSVSGAQAREDDQVVVPPPPPPVRLDTLPAQAPLRRTLDPNRIHWKGFIPVAAILAFLVGILTSLGGATPLGALASWLVLLPASIFVAVHFYRRRHLVPVSVRQGAKLGAMIAFLLFVLQAVVFVLLVVHDSAEFRHQLEEQLQQMLANAPDMQTREMFQTLVNRAGGVVAFNLLGMPIALGILLVIGGVSGALAAFLSRRGPGP